MKIIDFPFLNVATYHSYISRETNESNVETTFWHTNRTPLLYFTSSADFGSAFHSWWKVGMQAGPIAFNVTKKGEDAYLTPAGAKARPLHVHPKCSPRTAAHGVN